MIQIKHSDLDVIVSNYFRKVESTFLKRISILEEVVELLNRTLPINISEMKFQEYRGAIKAVLDKPKLNSNDENDLLKHFQSNKTKHGTRLIDVSHDLNIYNSKRLLKRVVTSKANRLKKEQDLIKSFIKLKNTKDQLVRYLFNYDYYYDQHIVPIANELEISVCPYCNRNFITHIQDDGKKRIIGPTFDHFFHKAKNPFLALSFYNLIPSCSVCNSNLKGQKDFHVDKHLHPYLNEAGNDFTFDFNLVVQKKNRAEIVFQPYIKVNVLNGNISHTRLLGDAAPHSGSLNVFRLNEIYASHFDVVQEIHEKFDKNSPHYVKSIAEQLGRLGVSEEEFYRFHFGNYFESHNFKKRPLAKLTKDIYDKMKKINPLY